MLELNLIRETILLRQGKKKYLKYFRMIYALCAVLVIAMTVQFIVLSTRMRACNRQLKAVSQRMMESKQRYGVELLEKEWADYYRRAALVDAMLDNRTVWAGRLEELSTVITPGLCVDRVVSTTENPTIVILDILAIPKERQGFELLDAFIGNIAKSRRFSKGVKLESQQRIKLNEKEVEFFKIQVPLNK